MVSQRVHRNMKCGGYGGFYSHTPKEGVAMALFCSTEIFEALDGMNFPATKEDILDFAQFKDAREAVVVVLNTLDDSMIFHEYRKCAKTPELPATCRLSRRSRASRFLHSGRTWSDGPKAPMRPDRPYMRSKLYRPATPIAASMKSASIYSSRSWFSVPSSSPSRTSEH